MLVLPRKMLPKQNKTTNHAHLIDTNRKKKATINALLNSKYSMNRVMPVTVGQFFSMTGYPEFHYQGRKLQSSE